jgi:plastocyanin
MRRLLLLPLAVAALVIANAAGAVTKTVQITKAGFVPSTTSVTVGDTVTWRNADAVNRQIVANDGTFASPTLKPGESFSFIFSKPGRVNYRDADKNSVRGTVVVGGQAAAVSLQASSQSVVFGSGTTLTGSVSSQASSEPVVLTAQPLGEKTIKQANVATTSSGGNFQFSIAPTIQTTYAVQWKTASSPNVTVFVRPRLGFGRRGSIFTARATSDISYQGHYVFVQRKKAFGSWRSVKKVFLGASSTARFRVALPHGRWFLRLTMPASQAGDGYIAGFSRTIIVRR